MSVRCLTEKGEVRFIPEKLAGMPEYMRRHKLTLDTLEPLEELKPLKEVVLEVEEPKTEQPEMEEVVSESTESSVEEITKEQYWAMLDAKGVEYKKTYGITKLKELNDAN